MPNWVYNEVEVSASADAVRSYLCEDLSEDGTRALLRFNLHRLFPERF